MRFDASAGHAVETLSQKTFKILNTTVFLSHSELAGEVAHQNGPFAAIESSEAKEEES
jgi:hypothetical protein